MRYLKAKAGNIVVNVCKVKNCPCLTECFTVGVVERDGEDDQDPIDCFKIFALPSRIMSEDEYPFYHKSYFTRRSDDIFIFNFCCDKVDS